ncbi:prepilin peptidase [Nereida sp. MMG024]|nr:prepilin peptidase [Nereida sp. MMG025]MCF6444995.1 prepilin peptidase [Nereida sp. MMG025]
MAATANSALVFLILSTPIALWAAWSDLSRMRIPNKSVLALMAIFAIAGLIMLPMDEYLRRWLQFAIVLAVGFGANAMGGVGAGDAKFAAAAAPMIALPDVPFLLMLFCANLLGTWLTHRLVKHTPLRNLAPNWKSWTTGWDYPMGFALSSTLIMYLAAAARFGS